MQTTILALVALGSGPALAQGDLVAGWISRGPRLDYVEGSSSPKREGWPAAGQTVTWEAHVRNWLARDLAGVDFRWVLDGAEVARGQVDIPAGATAVVPFPWTWTFARHELTFEIDPDDRVAEDEEGNNALAVFTDALSVGFYVEQGLYDHFRANQRLLRGARSNSFEDWAQRHIRRFNEMAPRAVYPETPDGVLDRFRIDEIVVVPDDALPLVPLSGIAQADADGHTHPNLADRSVDMLWGFKAADKPAYHDLTTVSDNGNIFYLQGALLHELGHARYLVDVYGWWVRDGANGDRVDIREGGSRVAGSALMPASGPMLHPATEQGLMNQSYGFVDRYSAIALNLIAGRRAVHGNCNEPGNLGVFLNDLPAENRVTVRDAGGSPVADADVWIYRATGGQPSYFSKVYDDVPDLLLRTDSQGRVLVGRCPFAADGRVVHDFGFSNVTAIVRVAKGSTVAYGFLESLAFNIAYWGGDTELADHELVVGRPCFTNPPYLVSPKPEAAVSGSPVTLTWEPLFGATGFEVWAASDGGPARLLGTTPASKTSLVAPLSGRVSWWVVASFASCPSERSGIGSFTVLPFASFTYSPAEPLPGAPVAFRGRAEGGPASYAWSFGDGGTSAGGTSADAEPAHAFASAGTYLVSLTVTTPSGSHSATRAIEVRAPPDSADTTLFVPLVLSAHGRAGSFFTSEMVVTNRGDTDARLSCLYTDSADGRQASVSVPLPRGRQLVVPDVLADLRSRGASLPDGDRVGTLRVTFEGLATTTSASITLRSTTPVAGGRAGLAYRALSAPELLAGTAFLCGLRQDERDRSNVAVQNAGLPEDGPITLRLTATSGDGRVEAALGETTLLPGQLHQISGALEVLGPPVSGYVKVERTSGSAPFYAYGVLNDQVTSDGSFIAPVAESSELLAGWTLPVAVETPVFSTELVLANLTAATRTVRLALGPREGLSEVGLALELSPFQQILLPDFVRYLREHGDGPLEARGSTIAAPVFLTDTGGDARGLFLGARVSSAGAGGRLGIFANALPGRNVDPAAAIEAAWLYGLRQDAENRANVALVNVGGPGSSPSGFSAEVFDGDSGLRVADVPDLATVEPRHLLQLNGFLSQLAPGVSNAYVRLRRSRGSEAFLTYAVINDGARPGERSDDGAYLSGVPER